MRTRGITCLLALAVATAAAPGVALAQTVDASLPPSPPASPVQATSGDESLDNAVAAVLVSALGRHFDGEAVALRIDAIHVGGAGARDRVVSGEGRMRLGDDPDWVGFRYRTLYDTTFGSAGDPELVFGGVGEADRSVPNDSTLMRQLEDRVVAELETIHGAGTRLQLDRITTIEAGHRFLRNDASGLADFGLRGASAIRIESLYDTHKGDWRRVEYHLGAGDGMR